MIDPSMLMSEIRRSLSATHPGREAEMMDALEILVRTRPTPVVMASQNPSDDDIDRATEMLRSFRTDPAPALILAHGWKFESLAALDAIESLDDRDDQIHHRRSDPRRR